MTDTRVLVFDMDGTIADVYGVSNHLSALDHGAQKANLIPRRPKLPRRSNDERRF